MLNYNKGISGRKAEILQKGAEAMDGKMGVVVIGAGGIARKHLCELKDTKRLYAVGVCDIDASRAQAMAEEFGVERVYTDAEQAIADAGTEAVVICTTNRTHTPLARIAVRYKKPYLLEKPIAMSREEARVLYEETKAAGVKNVVGFSYRFYPALRYAKHIVDTGALGKIYHIYCQYTQGLPEDTPRLWRYVKSEAATGTLGDLGSHMLDTARFLVGEFDSVAGHGGIFVHSRPAPDGSGQMLPVDTDDYFHLLARMENGAAATFAFSKFVYARQNFQRFEVYGSGGGLIYNQECGRDVIEFCSGEVYQKSHQYTALEIPDEFHMTQMQAFENVIFDGNGSGAADIYDGYRVQCLLDAAVESNERGTWVRA